MVEVLDKIYRTIDFNHQCGLEKGVTRWGALLLVVERSRIQLIKTLYFLFLSYVNLLTWISILFNKIQKLRKI